MGYGNLGDAAVQEAVIANIRKRLPDVRLVGFSLVPDDTTERHGIPCYSIRWWYPTADETDPPVAAADIGVATQARADAGAAISGRAENLFWISRERRGSGFVPTGGSDSSTC